MGAPPQGLHGASFQGQPLPTGDHLAWCRPSSSLACPASPVQGGLASCQATPSERGLGGGPSIPALDPPLQRRPEDPTASPRSRLTPGSSLPELEGAVERLRGCFPWADRESNPHWTGGLGGQLGEWRGREQPLALSGFSQMPSHGEHEPRQSPTPCQPCDSSKAENPTGYAALTQSPSMIQGPGPPSPQSLKCPPCLTELSAVASKASCPRVGYPLLPTPFSLHPESCCTRGTLSVHPPSTHLPRMVLLNPAGSAEWAVPPASHVTLSGQVSDASGPVTPLEPRDRDSQVSQGSLHG